jgi:DnaJ-domain-containing protein 1
MAMEIVFAVFMLGAGGALAVFVMAAMAIARRERAQHQVEVPRQDSVAASLLYAVLTSGGWAPEEALRDLRRGAGLAAPVTRGIDVSSWAESFALAASPQQRTTLLETAARLVAARGKPVPLRQYAALLDLSFGLGFHTDALAKLRAVYGFDYIDHAKDARPRSADRSGGGAPLYQRTPRDREALLLVLGVGANATRQEISSAYRRLVSQHHPDRFHGAPTEAQQQAAARFIEITRAYEELMNG